MFFIWPPPSFTVILNTDIDNIAKFVLDAINKKAYEDDGQVAVLSLAKLYTDTNPRVEVRIRKLRDNDVMFAENFDTKVV